MAITVARFDTLYFGLSSDTKPDDGRSVGIRFFETDTGDVYVYDGADWALEQSASNELTAGEEHIGEVGAWSDILELTLSLDTAQYADGDVLAATQVLANAVRIAGGKSLVDMVQVFDEDDQGVALDLLFFNADTDIGAENAAHAITDAESRALLGWVRVVAGDYEDWGGFRTATLKRGDSGFKLSQLKPAAGTSIYVAAVSRGTGTYSASGIRLKIHVL